MSIGRHLAKYHGFDLVAEAAHDPRGAVTLSGRSLEARHDVMHAETDWNTASERHVHRNGFVVKPMARSKAINPMSDKQRARIVTLAEATVVLVDWTGGRCQARIDGVCTYWGEHAHHVRRRSQGGSDTVSNLKWLCRACHSHVHESPAWAAEHGLLELRKTNDEQGDAA